MTNSLKEYKATDFQKGVILHSLTSTSGCTYNVQLKFNINMKKNELEIWNSWLKVTNYFDGLRVSPNNIDELDSLTMQEHESVDIIKKFHDLSNIKSKNNIISEIISSDEKKSFDLSSPPLFRLTLIKLMEKEYIFLFTFHHSILASSSLVLIFKAFFYFLESDDRTHLKDINELNPNVNSYYSYFDDNISKKSSEYWANILNHHEVNYFKQINLENAKKEEGFKHIEFSCGVEKKSEFNEFLKTSNYKLTTFLYTAWGILISRFLNNKSTLFGITRLISSNITKNVVSPCINTLPFSVIADSNTSIKKLLDLSLKNQTEIYNNLTTSLSNLLNLSETTKNFDSLFIYWPKRLHDQINEFSSKFGWKMTGLTSNTHYPIEIEVFGNIDNLTCKLTYNSSIISKSIAILISETFPIILNNLFENINGKVKDISIIAKDDEKRLLEMNDDNLKNTKHSSIYELFHKNLPKNKNKIAIIDNKLHITYAELEKLIKTTAGFLLKNNLDGKKIALLTYPSANHIVLFYAISRVNSTSIPINPDLPESRIRYMLNQANPDLIIRDHIVQDNHTDYTSINIEKIIHNSFSISIDTYKQSKNKLCYIIFTSGSSGKPKGVLIHEHSVINLIESINDRIKINKNDVYLSITSPSFDISIVDYIFPLINQAKLVIAPNETRTNPTLLKKTIDEFGITFIQATPSILNLLKAKSWCPNINSTIISAGEIFTASLAKYFLNKNTTIWNCYGPTEATIYSTIKEVTSPDDISVGSSIYNTGVYVLDYTKNYLPDGLPGTLYISGKGLLKGYTNGQRNLIKLNNNKLAYNTGDIAYKCNDNIYILGRDDTQIKINGIRVDINEVESAIMETGLFENSCIIFNKERNVLIAYIKLKKSHCNKNNDFICQKSNKILSKVLPGYMIPKIYHIVDSLPFNSNGKLDRKLIELKHKTENSSIYYEKTDVRISNVICDLLGIESKLLDNSLINLGGDSILAFKLMSSLKNKLNIDVSFEDIFQSSSLRSLINRLASVRNNIKTSTRTNNILNKIHCNELLKSFYLGSKYNAYFPGVSTTLYVCFKSEDINLKKLEYAINYVLNRHEILKMKISSDCCFIAKDLKKYKIDYISFNDEQRHHKFIDDFSQTSFNYDNPPFIKCVVTKLDIYFYVHIVIDAIICDGYSIKLLFEEIEIMYNNKENTIKSTFLSNNYLNYLSHSNITSNIEDEKYWDRVISKFTSPMTLPNNLGLRDFKTIKFKSVTSNISKVVWDKIKIKLSEQNISENEFLVVTYLYILSKWSLSNQLHLNIIVSNRFDLGPEFYNTLGNCTSNIIFSVEKSDLCIGNLKSFAQVVRLVSDKLRENLTHKKFTGVELQRKLIANNTELTSDEMIFPYVFTNNINDKQISLNNWEKTIEISQSSQVVLDNIVSSNNHQLIIRWDYVEKYFCKGILPDMHLSYIRLINYLSNHSWSENVNIPYLPDWQINLYNKLNNTSNTLPHTSLVDLALVGFKSNYNKIAVIDHENNISYKTLYGKSLKICSFLSKSGPNSCVGILLNKSWLQVAACVGINLSNNIFVPLSSSWPINRINKIIKSCDIKYLLTDKNFIDKQHQIDRSCKLVDINELLIDSDDIKISISPKPNDISYIIFTSGTTGTPKGVTITHKAAANTIIDINTKFSVDSKDSILSLSNLGFDLSIYDIFGMLAVGGTIIFPDEQHLRDPRIWNELIKKHNITIWNSVPAFMSIFVDYLELDNKLFNANLRLALLSGDWIPPKLPSKLNNLLHKKHQFKLISLGGATEAAIWSVYYPIDLNKNYTSSIPYGTPLSNQAAYVLDENLNFSPVWVKGKLYIGGDGLALEYINEPKLTEEKFIFHTVLQKRLYDTGDYARLLPNGKLEILGRIDNQVKIRGYRVECGEIEYIFEQLPYIDKVIVRNLPVADTAHRLLSFYTLKPTVKDTMIEYNILSEITNHLSKNIPEYMMPDEYYLISDIPLTNQGKIDYGKLIDFRNNTMKLKPVIKNHNHYLEKEVCCILSSTLSIPENKINLHTSFLATGGDSISAIKLLYLLKDKYKIDIKLSNILSGATLYDLIQFIESSKAKTIVRNNFSEYELIRRDILPISEMQKAYIMGRYNHMLLGNISPSVYMEYETDHINLESLELSFNQMIKQNPALRSIFTNVETQTILNHTPYIIECDDMRDMNIDYVGEFLIKKREQFINKQYNPDKFPLFQISVTKLNKKDIIHLSFDLVICDITSLHILLHAWEDIYFNRQKNISHTKCQEKYVQYVLAVNQLMKTKDFEHQKNYWLNKISETPFGPILECNININEVVRPTFGQITKKISKSQWRKFKNKLKTINITPSTYLLFAYATSINSFQKINDASFSINITVSNKPPLLDNIDDLIGEFTTVVPISFHPKLYKENTIISILSDLQLLVNEALENTLYSSVEYQKVLKNINHIQQNQNIFPVVFTSTLHLAKESKTDGKKERIFNNCNYFYNNTPQIILDCSVYEDNDMLYIRLDYVEELFSKSYIQDISECMIENIEDSMRLDSMFPNYSVNSTTDADKEHAIASTNFYIKSRNKTIKHYTPEDTNIEKVNTIVDICNKVLMIDHASMSNSFFELGGDSIFAAKFITMINQQFALNLYVKTIYQYPILIDFYNYIVSEIHNNNIQTGLQNDNVYRNNISTQKSSFSDFLTIWGMIDELYILSTSYALHAFDKLTNTETINETILSGKSNTFDSRYKKWIARANNSLAHFGKKYLAFCEEEIREKLDELILSLVKVGSNLNNEMLNHNQIDYIVDSARNLTKILKGIMHPASNYVQDVMIDFYVTLFRLPNEIISHFLLMVTKNIPYQLNIFEIGSGYGTTTDYVLKSISHNIGHYLYTDVSNFFLNYAHNKYVNHDFISYQLYDLNQSDEIVQARKSHYDIIIASSSIHLSNNIKLSLSKVYEHLNDNGFLILIEETRFYKQFDLGMGLQVGFDSDSEDNIRSYHPFLSKNEWLQILSLTGFDEVILLNEPNTISEFLGLDVIIAKKSKNSVFSSAYLYELCSSSEQLHNMITAYKLNNTHSNAEFRSYYGDLLKLIKPLNNIQLSSKHQSPLYILHPAIAGSDIYQHLAIDLDGKYKCFGVDSILLNTNISITNSLVALAAVYVEIIRMHSSTSEISLAGWSYGGVLSIEIARQLVSQGYSIKCVYLFDSYALNSKDRDIWINNKVEFNDLLFKNISKNINSDLSDYVRSIFDREIQSLLTYDFSSYCGKVTLFKATLNWLNNSLDNSAKNKCSTKSLSAIYEQSHNGWANILPNMSINYISFNHLTMMDLEGSKVLANFISRDD